MAIYSIYCSGSPNPVTLESMGASIKSACEMIQGGKLVLRIVGSEGFLMEQSDIETEYQRRAGIGRLKVAPVAGTAVLGRGDHVALPESTGTQ